MLRLKNQNTGLYVQYDPNWGGGETPYQRLFKKFTKKISSSYQKGLISLTLKEQPEIKGKGLQTNGKVDNGFR